MYRQQKQYIFRICIKKLDLPYVQEDLSSVYSEHNLKIGLEIYDSLPKKLNKYK